MIWSRLPMWITRTRRMTPWEKRSPSAPQKRVGGRIANELRMELRKIRREGAAVSLQEPLESGNGQLTLADTLPDDTVMEDDCERRADAARLRRLVDTLPARERALLQLRYGLGGGRPATQQQTADKLGISRSYVSRLEKRALTRLMNAWRR